MEVRANRVQEREHDHLPSLLSVALQLFVEDLSREKNEKY